MTIWYINDFPSSVFHNMTNAFPLIPKALPWVEPSINCLHQESVWSFMVGNYQCAILSMCTLMEHVLRLALVNKENCGYARPETMSQIDRYNSLTAIIDAAVGTDVFQNCDKNWWYAVAKNIRNKSAHYLLPTILRNCAADPILCKYIAKQNLSQNIDSDYYKKYITDWGAFYHKSGGELAVKFLNDATEQIRTVISNTNWTGDESWWISMKEDYEAFFSYDWSADNVEKSINSCRKEL